MVGATRQIGPTLQELDSTLGLSDPPSPWADHITGFAPYTPVMVSAKTEPTTATAIANRLKHTETIRDELWDGFNPFGSGPEPIGRREG